MGAAWALSVCYVHFPERTEDALMSERLDPEVLKKAMQKIRDSYRVSQEDKERLTEVVRSKRQYRVFSA
jgi:hypothetical protein